MREKFKVAIEQEFAKANWSTVQCNPEDIKKLFDNLPTKEVGVFHGIKVIKNTYLPSGIIALESEKEIIFINWERGTHSPIIDKINFKIKSIS